VTGANGFLGRVLCATLERRGHAVRAAVRDASKGSGLPDVVAVGDIDARTDWTRALQGVDTVIHAAARAHVLHDPASNEDLYARTNAEGTATLAAAAARSGIKRFVFVSSIKVNGEGTISAPFTAQDVPNPQDAYGRSKLAAERALFALRDTGLEPLVVRPPLVYGDGVRANFLRLLRWVDREVPLPLAAVKNSRSLVSVWNLADLLARLAEQGHQAADVFMVSDGEDLSTPELISRLAMALGRRALLLPVPVALLHFGASLVGKRDEIIRLCGSLTVDAEPTRRVLAWAPPLSVDEGLARTVAWYRREGGD
jgi:UDP-glucose 4-epimerase